MNDAESDAEKRKAAETLGIDIITEQQFNERLGRIFCITTESVLYKYVGLGGIVSVPNVVAFIGKDAFSSCPYLKEVTIPGSVISIGDSAFYHCTLLEKAGLSKGLIRIRQSAFAFCRSLKEITIPEGVLAIDDNAFWRCVALEKIVLPAELTSIGKDAFYDCAKLTIHAPAGSYAETYAKENNMFDKWTITDRLLKDDVTVENLLDAFTPAQIQEFIHLTTEKGCINCSAMLLNYRGAHFQDVDPLAEFTLDL